MSYEIPQNFIKIGFGKNEFKVSNTLFIYLLINGPNAPLFILFNFKNINSQLYRHISDISKFLKMQKGNFFENY